VDEENRKMKYLTYLLYIIFWELLVIGGAGYAVFIKGASGWWFLLAIYLSSVAYSPKKWIHGKI
jgi:hypothetical protein